MVRAHENPVLTTRLSEHQAQPPITSAMLFPSKEMRVFICSGKPFSPENCGWELPPVQARNQRSNVKVLFNGELLCLIDAAMAAGIDPALAYGRKAQGCPESRWFEPVK